MSFLPFAHELITILFAKVSYARLSIQLDGPFCFKGFLFLSKAINPAG
jgi:hypothetical protein